jgi:hypothetical protein
MKDTNLIVFPRRLPIILINKNNNVNVVDSDSKIDIDIAIGTEIFSSAIIIIICRIIHNQQTGKPGTIS